MSSLKNIVDSFTGGKQAAKSAREAAAVQARAADKAITTQEEAEARSRGDLDPFTQAGLEVLPGLTDLITDPEAQRSFIEDNPFFKSLAQEAKRSLLSSQAPRGRVGTGGTKEALQNSLLLLGTDLVNQNINQRQGLLGVGFNAAAGQANITQGTASNISNLLTGKGNVQAAGIVGARNAINQSRGGLINLGVQAGTQLGTATILACDIRVKENIIKVGQLDNGLPLYLFNYIGDDRPYINVIAQDVEKVKPHAVIEINNIKHVNMEEVWR